MELDNLGYEKKNFRPHLDLYLDNLHLSLNLLVEKLIRFIKRANKG